MKIRGLILTAALAGVTLTGCSMEDPCRNISDASKAEQQIAADHPEWEIETEGENDAECILQRSGNWTDETDD